MQLNSYQDVINTIGKCGWTVGNALMAYPYEITFNQPTTTADLIEYVRSLGFSAIRLPLNFTYHCDDNFTINPIWLDRIATIVDSCLANDMVIVLDVHDSIELDCDYEDYCETYLNYYPIVWKQIAEYFRDYDNRVIYELCNEPHCTYGPITWNIYEEDAPQVDLLQQTTDIMQELVDVIRSIDPDKYIIATPYCDSITLSKDSGFLSIEDPSDKILFAFHMYMPGRLTLEETFDITELTEEDKTNIAAEFKSMADAITNQHLICTEMGIYNKNNSEVRQEYLTYLLSLFKQYNIPCFIWDNGGEEAYGLIDRTNLTIFESAQPIIDLITGA